MEDLIFNNNFGLRSNLSEPIRPMPISVFIMKIVDINNNACNSKLKDGEIRDREQIIHAYQKGRSYLWQAIALLNRLHNEDAFNCHQNSDNKGITKTVTTDLYQISKVFTKTVKANIEFCASIKRFFLLVSTQVSTQNALCKWKPINKSLMLNREVRTKFAPKINFLMRTNLILGHVRRDFLEPIKKGNYLLGLANFSRQVAITQAEKLVFSFFACSFICSIKSWGKRMFLSLELLLLRPVAIFKPLYLYYLYLHYTVNNINKKDLICKYTLNYIVGTPINLVGFKNNDNSKYWHTTSYLTTNIKDTNAMANSNNTLHPKNGQQSKLFKFFDISTAQVIQTTATTERQARKNLGKQSLIFIARKPLTPTFELSINWGGYHYA